MTFSAKTTMKAVLTDADPEVRLFHLSRGLAWAFLDAQDRKKSGDHARNARRIGRIVIAERAHRILTRIANSRKELARADKLCLREFNRNGGIKRCVNAPTPRYLFSRVKEKELDTRVVFCILHYLCRASQSKLMPEQRKIKFAQKFAIQQVRRPNGRRFSPSHVTQKWEQYARGSALIYAAYAYWPQFGECDFEMARRELKKLAQNPVEIKRFAGYASFAANILSATRSTKAFQNSLQEAEPVFHPIQEFSVEEMACISKIDPKEPLR